MTKARQSAPGDLAPQQPAQSAVYNNLLVQSLLRRMKIGAKLTLGFGSLVALILLVIGVGYAASARATQEIKDSTSLRAPAALAAARAQADLLRIQADVRGYLALGDQSFRTDYRQDAQAFQDDLDELFRLAPHLTAGDQRQINDIKTTYDKWAEWPAQLFDLRDDQLAREPAYRTLATDGSQQGGTVLIDINNMIQSQANREPSADNSRVLGEMAQFQGTFAAMFSALRGYVTTRNPIYKQEYEVNLSANSFAWDTVQRRRSLLTANQQTQLDSIAKARSQFLDLTAGQILPVLESDRWRQDLYLFRAQALPLADQTIKSLDQLTGNQQTQLEGNLGEGSRGLLNANRLSLASAAVAIALGIWLALVFRANIAGPVRRLTSITEQIRQGDLDAKAQVESRDEIGVLAQNFNTMTGQLRHTLGQTRKEKKRADDLVGVVIPIGVQLAAERDFNRLLENMLLEAKRFCHAGSGVLYLRNEADRLEYVMVRDDALDLTLGGTTGQIISAESLPLYHTDAQAVNDGSLAVRAAVEGTPINLAHAVKVSDFDFCSPDSLADPSGRPMTSFLAIPLKTSDGYVTGVLQLTDARDPETQQVIPFDANLQQMMESFSLLAAAALEVYIREQGLKGEILQLRMEIDEVKRQQQVSEIVESNFFQNLQVKAREMRDRLHGAWPLAPEDSTGQLDA